MSTLPGEGFSPLPEQPNEGVGPSHEETEAWHAIEAALGELAFASSTAYTRWYGFRTDNGEKLEIKTNIAPRTDAITLACTIGRQRYEISQHAYDSKDYTLRFPSPPTESPTHSALEPFLKINPAEIPSGLNDFLSLLRTAEYRAYAEDLVEVPIDTQQTQELWAKLSDEADRLHVPTFYHINSTYLRGNRSQISVVATSDLADEHGTYIPLEEKVMQQIRISTRHLRTGDFQFVHDIYNSRLVRSYFLDTPDGTLPPLTADEQASNPYEVLPDVVPLPSGLLNIVYYICRRENAGKDSQSDSIPRQIGTPYKNEEDARENADRMRAFELAEERAAKAGITVKHLTRVMTALKLAVAVVEEDQEKLRSQYDTEE